MLTKNAFRIILQVRGINNIYNTEKTVIFKIAIILLNITVFIVFLIK